SRLLTAEESFVNRRLAKLYGIEDFQGEGFVRMRLPPNRRGLLGHASFLTAAVPLLRSYDATATMYVVTGHLEDDTPFSMMLVRDVLKRSRASGLATPLPEIEGIADPDLDEPAQRARFEAAVIARMKSLPPSSVERCEFARRVGAALGVEVDALIERRIWGVLTPAEIRSLSDDGFDMQVHGHTHLEVTDYPDDVLGEVERCREILEEITGKPARDFCYPSGRWTRAAWEPLSRAGMRSATTTRFGPNGPETPLLALRRNLDSESVSQLEFEYELSGLHWLLWSLRHRDRRWIPSERTASYDEAPGVF
ncbi:MAG: polysaccharide deacetylase family protein, partial [Gemmatimonadetes bacterium]|nr:polysaccharide deacetylase family protein [Gemmatimonadota bacterium]